MFDIPPFNEVREVDGDGEVGGLIGFHLTGHGHHPDVVDWFLNTEAADYLDYDDESPTEWEITETWVRTVPLGRTGAYQYVYSGPGRGARAITVIEHPWGLRYWCINHPDERAMTGIPASRVIDGEQVVADRLAALAADIDPRPDVQASYGYGDSGYIYMCRDCSVAFSERERVARIAAQAGVA